MPLIELPDELRKAFWDKKKGAVPAGSPLETQLKALEKKYQAVDWKTFEPGWDKATSPKALDEAWGAIDKAYRARVFALKLEAGAVSDAAQKLQKDKAAGKPTLEASRSIVDAVKAWGKTIDQGLEGLAALHDKAAKALKANATEDEDEDETPNALLDPKRLLQQLQLLQRMPERKVNFAFLNDGKSPPLLALAPRTSGKKLFTTLQTASGVKTGGYGQAWMIDKVLTLSMEKPSPGIVKKARLPIKAAGFKVRKIVLAGEDGQVVESDEEDDTPAGPQSGDSPAPALAPAATPASASASNPAEQAYLALRERLLPLAREAQAAGHAAAAKIQPLLDFAQGKADAGAHAAALQALQSVDKLLATPPGGAAPGGAPQSQWSERQVAVKARVAAAVALGVPESPKLTALLDFAVGKAAAGQFDKALGALVPLEALLASVEQRGNAAPAAAPAPGTTSGKPVTAEALMSIWIDAKEQTDGRINQLREALLKHQDPRLARIADEGITASGLVFMTGGRMTALATALNECRGKPVIDGPLRSRAAAAAGNLKSFLATDPLIATCENNPLTTDLGIRTTLIPALERIESLLAA